MNHRNLIIAAGAAAIALAGVALASPGQDRLAQVDTNKDGQVQVAEIQAQAAQRAARIDADADGKITIDEVKAHREKLREEREQARFERMDANGDGSVSTEEFAIAQSSHAAKLDINGDGVIAKEEFRGGRHGRRGGGRHHAAD